ncbi:MAG: hypothetical protein QOF70_809 [Acetobacteraceae bacterium]|jgi:hypothetical protein|nr:hypothetical protein [Acetobacteraceae bacterium]
MISNHPLAENLDGGVVGVARRELRLIDFRLIGYAGLANELTVWSFKDEALIGCWTRKMDCPVPGGVVSSDDVLVGMIPQRSP